MTDALIDEAVFTELADAMGAEFAAELVDTFLSEAPGMFAELRAAFVGRDADNYRRAAHSIKSNADVFGARALADQARAMEMSELPENDTAIATLDAIYADTSAALKARLHD
ncbi:Hpt domain-containing protein [Tateyamaria sp. Alg231-49]|uniref:Hpt domain-containing protein n=1 Tax=Tateyamaria sp. Alg231-49 TaxID=1922219 RepID=UPI000D557382|nr:Hpt domain-containing protein [Tateyamaria sp. Alg231-49]